MYDLIPFEPFVSSLSALYCSTKTTNLIRQTYFDSSSVSVDL